MDYISKLIWVRAFNCNGFEYTKEVQGSQLQTLIAQIPIALNPKPKTK